jgi:hypothetical protein
LVIQRTVTKSFLYSFLAVVAAGILFANIAAAGCIGGFEVGPVEDPQPSPAAVSDAAAAPAVVSTKLPQAGDVLIAGGVGSAGLAIASAQFYNATTGAFVSTPPMGAVRAAHQAVMFSTQNEVLLVGGFMGKAKPTGSSIVFHFTTLPTGRIYYTTKGIFGAYGATKNKMQSGNSDDDRAFFPAVTLPPTTTQLSELGFFPSGLCNGDVRPTAFTFDPTANAFSLVGNEVVTTRAFHTATLLNDGTVLIAGGITDFTGDATSSAEIFNPATGAFTATTGTMTTPRAGHTATLLANGTVLITGGASSNAGTFTSLNTAEIYDPTTELFSPTTGPMTAFRWQHTATLLGDGTVLLTGGFDGTASWVLAPFGKKAAGDAGSWTPTSGSIEGTSETYDSTTGTFTAGPAMIAGRFGHTATLLTTGPNTGDVLIVAGFGGNVPGTPLKTTELYTPGSSAAFSAGPSLKAARAWHTATLIQ